MLKRIHIAFQRPPQYHWNFSFKIDFPTFLGILSYRQRQLLLIARLATLSSFMEFWSSLFFFPLFRFLDFFNYWSQSDETHQRSIKEKGNMKQKLWEKNDDDGNGDDAPMLEKGKMKKKNKNWFLFLFFPSLQCSTTLLFVSRTLFSAHSLWTVHFGKEMRNLKELPHRWGYLMPNKVTEFTEHSKFQLGNGSDFLPSRVTIE